MKDEYLSRCVVNPLTKTFTLYSDRGSEREVSCETIDQFMNVLEVVRSRLSEETIEYSNPT